MGGGKVGGGLIPTVYILGVGGSSAVVGSDEGGGGGGSGGGGGGGGVWSGVSGWGDLQNFRITHLINAETLAKFCTERETKLKWKKIHYNVIKSIIMDSK